MWRVPTTRGSSGRPRTSRRDIMKVLNRARASFLASTALVLGLMCAPRPTYAEPVANQVMLVNAKTGKCLTIAGGVSTANNVESVQFDCDDDPSRRWMLNE